MWALVYFSTCELCTGSCQRAGNRHGLERAFNGSIALKMDVTFKILVSTRPI